MSFAREQSIDATQNGDTVKSAILKLDSDLTNLFDNVNAVNTLTSQKISQTEKGATNGVCSLDANSKIPVVNIPDETKPVIGSVIMFAGEVAPDGWFECNGAEYPIATYPLLFAAIGYLWGGLGLNFKIPDMRGYFPRGWDHGASIDPDKLTRSGGDHVGSSQTGAVGPHKHNVNAGWNNGTDGNGQFPMLYTSGTSVCDTANNTGTETRPINKNLMFIVKHD